MTHLALVTKTSWYFFSSGRKTTSQLLRAVCAVLTTTFRSSTSCSKFLILSNNSFSLVSIVIKFCGGCGARTHAAVTPYLFSKQAPSPTWVTHQKKSRPSSEQHIGYLRKRRDSNPRYNLSYA